MTQIPFDDRFKCSFTYDGKRSVVRMSDAADKLKDLYRIEKLRIETGDFLQQTVVKNGTSTITNTTYRGLNDFQITYDKKNKHKTHIRKYKYLPFPKKKITECEAKHLVIFEADSVSFERAFDLIEKQWTF